MAVLEKLINLQSQGLSDQDIIKRLRDEGFQPAEINDAFGQAKIKQAVSQDPEFQGMEQSIMDAPQQQPIAQEYQAPMYPQSYEPQQQYYSPEQMQPQLDTETITEIADQVCTEKFSEFNKKTGDLVSFKNEAYDRMRELDERLKRIESSIDQIQKAIIGKIGEYGENMAFVQKDLTNIHDTMSKMMNPLIDNYKELRRIAGK